jgi:pimeloyl-ACP methyl ester carboxylesterase
MDRRTAIRLLSSSALGSALPSMASAAVRRAPDLPRPKMVRANGIRMAVYELGEGTPVVFCHGFPELAFSWRHQMRAVADAGFRAIAADLRGYGLTDRPGAVADYAATRVCDDLAGMMDSMDLEQAIFCGHDWGGYVADSVAALYPERCLGLIGAGSPHNYRPPDLPPPDVKIENLVDKAAFNRFLQQPDVPDELLDHHVRKFFTTFSRSGYFTADYLRTLPEDSAERRMDLPAMLAKENLPGTMFLSKGALEYYVDTFSATGFTGAINWYRAIPITAQEIRNRNVSWGLNVPYLYVWFEQDPIIRAGVEAYLTDYIDDFEMQTIDAGHSALEQKPEQLSRSIVDWLRRKFAA